MSELTYGQTLKTGTTRLTEAGIEYAREEARAFLVWVCDISTIDLISLEHAPFPDEHAQAYHDTIERRASGEPLQHIVGQTVFYGIPLKTDPRALIPRSDSECVVELALEYLPTSAPAQIADLGTGTCALLIALLTARTKLTGIAVEQNADAANLAAENIQATGLSTRTELFKGNWTDWTGWATTDLIISNPPYIASSVIPTLAPEVRDHDPMDALDGGVDGLDAYREIITMARDMKPGAHLVLEIGYDQKTAVTALLIAANFSNIAHRKDLGGNDRAIAATAP